MRESLAAWDIILLNRRNRHFAFRFQSALFLVGDIRELGSRSVRLLSSLTLIRFNGFPRHRALLFGGIVNSRISRPNKIQKLVSLWAYFERIRVVFDVLLRLRHDAYLQPMTVCDLGGKRAVIRSQPISESLYNYL